MNDHKPPQRLCPHCGHDQKRCAWSPSGKEAELLSRTIKIIERGGVIFLKRKDGWYLGQWTNIASGPDKADWGKRKSALEMFNLKWAFTIAPLYGCKVVVRYPKAKKLPLPVPKRAQGIKPSREACKVHGPFCVAGSEHNGDFR